MEEQKKEREKAETFSKEMNEGKWKPKTAISVIDEKKKKRIKTLRMEMIQSPDEEDDDDDEGAGPVPEGFHLLDESVHCLNIGKSDEFKAYCHQICTYLIQMVRQGRGVEEEY